MCLALVAGPGLSPLPPAGAVVELPAGGTQANVAELSEGDLLHVAIDPEGVDVALRIFGPDGALAWARLEAEMARGDARYVAFATPRPVGLAEAQATLAADEALLEYFLGRETS